MVLLNIGVDINEPNELNYTPLAVARANGFKDIETLLMQHKAQIATSVDAIIPTSTVLEIHPERRSERSAGPQSQYKEFYRVTTTRKYF